MSETQESCCQWAEETFGIAGSLFRIATRANEEMAELLVAVELTPETVPEEAADITIILCRAAKRIGCSFVFDMSERRQLYSSVPVDTAIQGASHLLEVMAGAALIDGMEDATFCSRRKTDQEQRTAAQLVEVVYACWLICEQHETELQAEVDRKMSINRTRTWNVGTDGHGYHCGA